MTDDHARSASEDEPDSRSNADGPNESPGGGPKRTVSETSVDDILASIDSGPDESGEEAEADDGAGDADDDEGSVDPDGDEGEVEGSDDGDTAARSADDEDADAAATDVSVAFDEDELGEGTAAEESADDREVDQSAVERRAGDLEERIERGAVTGADVRAAEAGEGRDSTPSVDEIDLSIDDLEVTGEDGPSAGEGGDRSVGEQSDETERLGLVDRLKRLLSR